MNDRYTARLDRIPGQKWAAAAFAKSTASACRQPDRLRIATHRDMGLYSAAVTRRDLRGCEQRRRNVCHHFILQTSIERGQRPTALQYHQFLFFWQTFGDLARARDGMPVRRPNDVRRGASASGATDLVAARRPRCAAQAGDGDGGNNTPPVPANLVENSLARA